jgi:hypothetical protein
MCKPWQAQAYLTILLSVFERRYAVILFEDFGQKKFIVKTQSRCYLFQFKGTFVVSRAVLAEDNRRSCMYRLGDKPVRSWNRRKNVVLDSPLSRIKASIDRGVLTWLCMQDNITSSTGCLHAAPDECSLARSNNNS